MIIVIDMANSLLLLGSPSFCSFPQFSFSLNPILGKFNRRNTFLKKGLHHGKHTTPIFQYPNRNLGESVPHNTITMLLFPIPNFFAHNLNWHIITRFVLTDNHTYGGRSIIENIESVHLYLKHRGSITCNPLVYDQPSPNGYHNHHLHPARQPPKGCSPVKAVVGIESKDAKNS